MADLKFAPKSSKPIDLAKAIDTSTVAGSSVLITGGASGLGAAFAVELASKGCYVTIVDINAELGKTFTSEQQGKSIDLNFVQADVVDYTSLLQAFKSAVEFSPTKTLDIVIPCAGLFGPPINALLPDPSSSEDPPAPSTAVLDVNFKGVYLTAYLALHYFRRASTFNLPNPKPKQILFICSILAYLEAPLNLSYCGSKHGIRGLFRSLRWEGSELSIPSLRVNLIAPTLMKTPMTQDFWDYLRDVRGFALGEAQEAVELGVRLFCDEAADGRAIAVVPGLGNVDLCDDFEGSDGARESLRLIKEGHLGAGPSATGRFIV